MVTVTIRTDKPEAEIGLYQNTQMLAYHTWPAHRQLAETIHTTLADVLVEQGLTLHDIEAVVAYKGPGSFTGLRIGLSVANALAAGLSIPILASGGESWQATGIRNILDGAHDAVAVPEYGALPNITKPRK